MSLCYMAVLGCTIQLVPRQRGLHALSCFEEQDYFLCIQLLVPPSVSLPLSPFHKNIFHIPSSFYPFGPFNYIMRQSVFPANFTEDCCWLSQRCRYLQEGFTSLHCFKGEILFYITMRIHPSSSRVASTYTSHPVVIINSILFPFQKCLGLDVHPGGILLLFGSHPLLVHKTILSKFQRLEIIIIQNICFCPW